MPSNHKVTNIQNIKNKTKIKITSEKLKFCNFQEVNKKTICPAPLKHSFTNLLKIQRGKITKLYGCQKTQPNLSQTTYNNNKIKKIIFAEHKFTT